MLAWFCRIKAPCVFTVAEHYFWTTSSGHLWSPQVAGIFTQSYLRQSQVAETLTLYVHKSECPHVDDKWSPLKLVASHWFSVALPHQRLSDFLWRDHWLYIITDVYLALIQIGQILHESTCHRNWEGEFFFVIFFSLVSLVTLISVIRMT